MTKKQNITIKERRKQLSEHKLHLERQIAAEQQYSGDLEKIERFCQLVNENLKDLSFGDKRLALEALRVKVWVDGNNTEITGTIPMSEGDIVTMPSY